MVGSIIPSNCLSSKPSIPTRWSPSNTNIPFGYNLLPQNITNTSSLPPPKATPSPSLPNRVRYGATLMEPSVSLLVPRNGNTPSSSIPSLPLLSLPSPSPHQTTYPSPSHSEEPLIDSSSISCCSSEDPFFNQTISLTTSSSCQHSLRATLLARDS